MATQLLLRGLQGQSFSIFDRIWSTEGSATTALLLGDHTLAMTLLSRTLLKLNSEN